MPPHSIQSILPEAPTTEAQSDAGNVNMDPIGEEAPIAMEATAATATATTTDAHDYYTQHTSSIDRSSTASSSFSTLC